MGHIFSTRQGRKLRQAIVKRDMFQCRMCGVLLINGKTDRRAAVVDHIIPASLAPHLEKDPDNLWLICKADHDGPCASIEAKHEGDGEAIKAAKLAHRTRRIGLDGYPIP